MFTSKTDYFKKITNSENNDFDHTREDVDSIKESIGSALQKNNDFGYYLSNLSMADKSSLIKALILNDREEINRFLLNPIQKFNSNANSHSLKYFTELDEKDDANQIVNRYVHLIIQAMIRKYTHHVRSMIIQKAIGKIRDTDFGFKLKKEIVEAIDEWVIMIIADLSYNPILAPIQKNKYNGNISVNEYFQICKNNALDYSEFIINTLGVLQFTFLENTHASADLIIIRNLYNDLNYEKAITAIKDFCEKYSMDEQLKQMIFDKASKCYLPDERNFTRRFYENRLAQLENSKFDLDDLASINKVSQAITGVTIDHVNQIDDIFIANSSMSMTQQVQDRVKHFRRVSRVDTSKQKKEGMVRNREEFINKPTQVIWTKNPGIMLSNQPNFLDEQSEFFLRNRTSDKHRLIPPNELKNTSLLGSYVGGLSGHALILVASLENYIEKNPHDSDLSYDVNIYLKGFILFNINHGYHSASEIIKIFQLPYIEDVFKHYNVVLDFNWMMPASIEQATIDTQEYSKMLCLKKCLDTEFKLKQAHEEAVIFNFSLHHKLKDQITWIIFKLKTYLREKNEFFSNTWGIRSIVTEAIKQLNTIVSFEVKVETDCKDVQQKRNCILENLKRNSEFDDDLSDVIKEILQRMELMTSVAYVGFRK